MKCRAGSIKQGAGSREQGAGSIKHGAGSREHGVGGREQGVGSREMGAGSKEWYRKQGCNRNINFRRVGCINHSAHRGLLEGHRE